MIDRRGAYSWELWDRPRLEKGAKLLAWGNAWSEVLAALDGIEVAKRRGVPWTQLYILGPATGIWRLEPRTHSTEPVGINKHLPEGWVFWNVRRRGG
jgi:hypothetical protein